MAAEQGGAIRLSREEHKYLLAPAKAAEVARLLTGALSADSFDNGAGYRVKSLYLDTPYNRDFTETTDGIYARQKLRLRLYDEADTNVKLECKQKRGTKQRKLTLPIGREQAKGLCRGDTAFLLDIGTPEALEIYTVASTGYRPVVMVEYLRRAFTWPAHNTRITLDSNVQSCTTNLDLFHAALPYSAVLPPGSVVLEVKYDQVLEPFLRRLLRGYCDSRQSVSKYANSRLAGYWAL